MKKMKRNQQKGLGNKTVVLNGLSCLNTRSIDSAFKACHYEEERDYRCEEYERIEWIRHGLGLEYKSSDSLWYWEEWMSM